MCVVDKVFHEACCHESYHLIMPCHAPKYPYPNSHDPLCPSPTIRMIPGNVAMGYECVACAEKNRKATMMKKEAAMAVKVSGSNKENVKY